MAVPGIGPGEYFRKNFLFGESLFTYRLEDSGKASVFVPASAVESIVKGSVWTSDRGQEPGCLIRTSERCYAVKSSVAEARAALAS